MQYYNQASIQFTKQIHERTNKLGINFNLFSHTFPSRAITGWRMPVTQCAAVNTNESDISDPPHKKLTVYCCLM